MKKENIISMITKNKLKVGIVCGVVVVAAIGSIAFIANQKKVTFALTDNVIEYGEDSTEIDWLKKATTNATEVSATIDTKKIGGDIDVDFQACIDDLCNTVTQKITIKDTKPPEIKVKQDVIEIEQDTDFDALSNIESVTDVVDGDIKHSDQEVKKDGYYITGDVDVATSAEYTVKIIAIDKNGNKTEKEFKVIVKEKGAEGTKKDEMNSPARNENNGGSSSTDSTSPVISSGSGGISTGENNSSGINTPINNDGGNQHPHESEKSSDLCPNGWYPDRPCNALISGEGVPGNSGIWTSNEQEAIDASHDFSGQWEGHSSYIGVSEWNDGRIMYTVIYY